MDQGETTLNPEVCQAIEEIEKIFLPRWAFDIELPNPWVKFHQKNGKLITGNPELGITIKTYFMPDYAKCLFDDHQMLQEAWARLYPERLTALLMPVAYYHQSLVYPYLEIYDPYTDPLRLFYYPKLDIAHLEMVMALADLKTHFMLSDKLEFLVPKGKDPIYIDPFEDNFSGRIS